MVLYSPPNPMLFNSVHFLIFLPVVAAVYFLLPLRARRVFLLAASFYFYCVWSVKWSFLMAYTIAQDYAAIRILSRSDRPGVRRAALVVSLGGNLLILGLFKYYGFFNNTLAALLGHRPLPVLDLILPMGISFYTFQTMSYVIDVYRRDTEPPRSLLDFALFITFFPQLVAGPIMRGKDLLPQFFENHRPEGRRILSGVLLCVWGLLKKTLVADPMGVVVQSVYGTAGAPLDPSGFSGGTLLLATYAFAVQIYCDFSAYSDICIGAGRILGFRIMENFNSPYLAVSITDFWRRWHISLSTWLRDYLYIPLGGNRLGRVRTYINLMATMLLGGLWHGANWTFVIWGGLHGVYLSIERVLGIHSLDTRKMSAPERWIRRGITFHLVCLSWIFFRCPTFSQAFEILRRIAAWAQGQVTSPVPLACILAIVAVETAKQRIDFHELFLRRPIFSRWVVYACVGLLFIVLSTARSPEFIYFQF